MRVIYIHIIIFITCTVSFSYPVKIIAHRGVSSLAPENTISAFRKAIEMKADYFELDVWFSKDDSLMVIHDETVNNTTNDTGTVNSFTYKELKELDAGSWFNIKFKDEKIPTLFEVLSLVKQSNSNIGICIHITEYKSRIVNPIINIVKSMQMEDQVIIFSFDYNRLMLTKQLDPHIKTLWLLPDKLTQDLLAKASQISIDLLGARPSDSLSHEIISESHKLNMQVWKWTVDDSVEMIRLINLGIDGIITDLPQLLVKIFEIPTTYHSRNSDTDTYILYQNYPNPFNTSSKINYYFPEKCFYRLALYDILGHEILVLKEGINEKGYYSAEYDRKDNCSGIYIYILDIWGQYYDKHRIVKKMTILK